MRCACGISPSERGRAKNKTLSELAAAKGEAADLGSFGTSSSSFFVCARNRMIKQSAGKGEAADLSRFGTASSSFFFVCARNRMFT